MSELEPVILAEVVRSSSSLSAGMAALQAKKVATEYPWFVFNSSQTFEIPSDGDYEIHCIGGGAAVDSTTAKGISGGHGAGAGVGGASGSTASAGSAGGYAVKQKIAMTAGQQVTIVVGSGGVPGVAPGRNGGNSSVTVGALTITANGGTSVGGTAVGGDINLKGGDAGTGSGGGGVGGGKGLPYRSRKFIFMRDTGSGTYEYTLGMAGDGGWGGGGAGIGYEASGTNVGSLVKNGSNGQTWLDVIPGYKGPGSFDDGFGGPGLVAIRRVV